MENTAMQKILAAEKRADEIIAEGVRRARDISDESALELKKMTTDFEEKLETDIAAILESHIEKAEQESRELEVSFAEEFDRIKKQASGRIDRAADYVIEKMGDSRWQ